jgi:uncharacterized protein (TIGR02147 family)
MNANRDILSCSTCLEALETRLDSAGTHSGYKAALAAAGGFHPSFLSHVMKGKAQLAPEHAVGIARFWNLTEDETEYFVELAHYARATTGPMKEYLKGRLEQIRKRGERRMLKGSAKSLSGESAKSLYYATWYHAAVHVSTTIPAFQTSSAIARRISLPIEVVERTLADLERMGLVERNGSRWTNVNSNLWTIGDHHSRSFSQQWALRAAQVLEIRRDPDSLFRTSVYSVSKGDFRDIRQQMLRHIRGIDEIAIPSPGEELICLQWHLFKV